MYAVSVSIRVRGSCHKILGLGLEAKGYKWDAIRVRLGMRVPGEQIDVMRRDYNKEVRLPQIMQQYEHNPSKSESGATGELSHIGRQHQN